MLEEMVKNMKYNRNLEKLPKYVFEEFFAKKIELEKKGIKVIDLGVGDPDIETPKQIAEAAVAELKNYHGYPAYSKGVDVKKSLSEYVETINQIGFNLQPFLPQTAEKIIKQFSGKIKSAESLFPRLV